MHNFFNRIILLIVGLAFAGMGSFFLIKTSIATFQIWQMVQEWQPITAELLSVKGSDNDTEATYRYQISGVTYQNDRVYVAELKDNIGSYHKQLTARLKESLRLKKKINIWINPDDPQQSIIDREMRWGLFSLMTGFCSLFILIGLAVIYSSLKRSSSASSFSPPSKSSLKREWREKNKNPDYSESFIEYRRFRLHELKKETKNNEQGKSVDWKQRKGWETNQIHSNDKLGLWAIWIFTIFWSALSSPLLFNLNDELDKENYAILIGLLFPIIGIGLLFFSIKKTIEYFRYGVIIFEMSPYPGSIGGQVGGDILVNKSLSRNDLNQMIVKITLECVYSYTSGSGKNNSRSETIKWAEEGEVKPSNFNKGFRIQFHFDIPENLPEADIKQSASYIFWRLKVQGKVDGVDLNRHFNIPVFNTGQAAHYPHNNLSEQYKKIQVEKSEEKLQAIQRGDFHLTELSDVIQIQDSNSELQLYFPMLRKKVLFIFSLIFAAAFGFGSYMMTKDFSSGDGMSIFSTLFSIPFVLVALLASIASIQLLFGNFSTKIRNDAVTVMHRLLFFPIRYYKVNYNEINNLSVKRIGSTGQGVDRVKHFKIMAHRKNGSSFTIATDINGEDLAMHFKEYLLKRMQIN